LLYLQEPEEQQVPPVQPFPPHCPQIGEQFPLDGGGVYVEPGVVVGEPVSGGEVAEVTGSVTVVTIVLESVDEVGGATLVELDFDEVEVEVGAGLVVDELVPPPVFPPPFPPSLMVMLACPLL